MALSKSDLALIAGLIAASKEETKPEVKPSGKAKASPKPQNELVYDGFEGNKGFVPMLYLNSTWSKSRASVAFAQLILDNAKDVKAWIAEHS